MPGFSSTNLSSQSLLQVVEDVEVEQHFSSGLGTGKALENSSLILKGFGVQEEKKNLGLLRVAFYPLINAQTHGNVERD